MRRERIQTFLMALALSAAVSMGSVCCFVTGFRLEPDSLPRVLAACLLGGAVSAALLLRRRGGTILLCLLAVTAGFLWRDGRAIRQLFSLIYRISYVYNGAYHLGVLEITEASRVSMAPDFPLGIWGCLTAILVSHSVCRRRSVLPGVVMGIFPLGLCLVVTDTVPGVPALFALSAGISLLLLTGNVRRESTAQGNRLTRIIALPVLGLLALLFVTVPQEGYTDHSAAGREWLLSRITRLQETVQTESLPVISGGGSIDLAALNGQMRNSRRVMEVTADYSGAVYLRGRDYDAYTGTGWQADRERSEHLTGSGPALGFVTVRPVNIPEGTFVPSFPELTARFSGGEPEEGVGSGEYGFAVRRDGGTDLTPRELLAFQALPEVTAAGCRKYIDRLQVGDGSPAALAGAVRDYVSSAADYDRDTGAMAPGAEDFALWFLESSDTGYCVHFATAAVVLLRAAGVPARYVTGYMVEVQANVPETVTGDDAHAWAEYYDSASGCWRILEATPADSGSTPAIPQPTVGTAPTMVPETTQPQRETPEKTESAPPERDTRWVGRVLFGLGILAGCALLLELQRTLRCLLRRSRLGRGGANTRFVARWGEAEKLANLLGEPMPEELTFLAEKAIYSQHTLTREETAQLEDWCEERLARLRGQNPLRRLINRYLYAIE